MFDNTSERALENFTTTNHRRPATARSVLECGGTAQRRHRFRQFFNPQVQLTMPAVSHPSLTSTMPLSWLSLSQTLVARSLPDRPSPNVIISFISNWFDAKWLRFSGKGLVPFWARRTTVPPFHPSRVLEEAHFRIEESTNVYELFTPKTPLHGHRSSTDNFLHYLDRLHPDTHLFWISDPSPDRLCFMHYAVAAEETHTSYLAVERQREHDWRIVRHRGITGIESQRLLPNDEPARTDALTNGKKILQQNHLAIAWNTAAL
jgi:hypothetical protein